MKNLGLLNILWAFSFSAIYSNAQVPYVFESPSRKADIRERLNLVKAGVKQRNTFFTDYDEFGNISEKRTQTYTTKYNQLGTTSIGEYIKPDSTKSIQIFEYKPDETITTDIVKDKNNIVLSTKVYRRDKHGKLIRDGKHKLPESWSIDTINPDVICYRSLSYNSNGKKGYTKLYYVSKSNDSLITKTLNPDESLNSEFRYYFDSNGNLIKEFRSGIGSFLHKYDQNGNEIELLEFREDKLFQKIVKTYNSNNLIIEEKCYTSKNVLVRSIDYEYQYF